MASNAPGACCIAGIKHEGEAGGSIMKVGTHDAYVAYPSDRSTKHGIILFPDFMGYELIKVKLIADQFAANGFFTVVPDVWEGDNVRLNWNPAGGFDLMGWVGKHGPENVEPIGEAAINAMRTEHGVETIAAVGYCLGAKYVCRFLAKGKGVHAGFFAHPSATSAEEVKLVSGPLTIAAAGTGPSERCSTTSH